MKGPKTQFLVDLLALVALLGLTSTGLVLSWVLPPGSGRLAVAHGPVVLLWGLDRQAWGMWHTRLAYLTLLTLAIHIGLHYRWIVAMVRRVGGWRLWPVPLLGMLAVAPLVSKTQVVQPPPANPAGGSQLYSQHCLRCHGQEARGIPPLPGPDEQALKAILTARPQNLHAFVSELTAGEQLSLLGYLRSLQSAKP